MGDVGSLHVADAMFPGVVGWTFGVSFPRLRGALLCCVGVYLYPVVSRLISVRVSACVLFPRLGSSGFVRADWLMMDLIMVFCGLSCLLWCAWSYFGVVSVVLSVLL